MRYDLDLRQIPLDAYRDLLQNQNLLPSRRVLLDGLEDNFMRIRTRGVGTVEDLMRVLSSPGKLEDFARESGVPAAYLTILRREAGTLKRKPVPLHDFPDTDPALIASLLRRGIKTSKAYFESGGADGELLALCDLSRINGVGPHAAKMFYEAGYRSAAAIAEARAEEMLVRISAVNAGHRYYQGTLGEKDLRFCIDFAGVLERFSQ